MNALMAIFTLPRRLAHLWFDKPGHAGHAQPADVYGEKNTIGSTAESAASDATLQQDACQSRPARRMLVIRWQLNEEGRLVASWHDPDSL